MVFLISATFLSISSWSCAAFVPPHVSYQSTRWSGAHLSMASTMMESTRQSFEERMRNAVLGGRTKEVTPSTKATTMPVNLKIASSLDDYKRIVGGERERIVVVRFFAPWCKVRSLLRLVRRCTKGRSLHSSPSPHHGQVKCTIRTSTHLHFHHCP